MPWKRQICVLMVDDSDDDQLLVSLALERIGVAHQLWRVSDGEQAVQYLTGTGPFSDRKAYPFPDVLLVDLKMPKMGGFELLRWLAENPDHAVIPTVVFSSSGLKEDVDRAYRSGANAFLVKPADVKELMRVVQQMFEFWSTCELPSRKAAGDGEREPIRGEKDLTSKDRD